MYNKFLNLNNIWETLHYKFPVAKSSTTDPDMQRAVMIDQTIKDEETARINEDIRINKRVDKEIEDRIAAVENEANLRASADDSLKSLITDFKKTEIKPIVAGSKFTNAGSGCIVKNGICTLSMEITPIEPVANGDIVCTGLPLPVTAITFGITTTSGIYTAKLQTDGSIIIYYPIFTDIARADFSLTYPIAE